MSLVEIKRDRGLLIKVGCVLLLMFQPRPYSVSAMASCIVVIFTGSTLVASYLWLPVIAMSNGYVL
tara:strand:+ start:5179 stop:5376 length:198 start_codon:yes stop_codon:yes gene_type:complete